MKKHFYKVQNRQTEQRCAALQRIRVRTGAAGRGCAHRVPRNQVS